MAYTEKERLEMVLARFQQKLYSIKTWADFKIFVDNLTKAKVKQFINNALDAEADRHAGFSVNEFETEANIRAIKTDVDAL